jgi:hypothetical protein
MDASLSRTFSATLQTYEVPLRHARQSPRPIPVIVADDR